MTTTTSSKVTNIEQAATELIARANQNGGLDNITTILFKFLP